VRIKRSDLQRFVDQGYLGTPAEMPLPKGPSADDFWGGEPVGVAEVDPLTDEAAVDEPGPGDTERQDDLPSGRQPPGLEDGEP
jgi:hypothetical protein